MRLAAEAASISSRSGAPSSVLSPSGAPAAPSWATTSALARACGTPAMSPSRPIFLYSSIVAGARATCSQKAGESPKAPALPV